MKNLIGEDWFESSDGSYIDVINPATSEFIDTVPNSTVVDVDHAVKVALSAQKKWAAMSIQERGKILMKFAQLCEERKDELATVLCKETGKPITEALAEVSNLQISVPGFVERAKHLYGTSIPAGTEAGQEKTIQITVQEPLGVVACIIPFNFPCDLFGQKVPSALIMGNAVIVKPSTANPLTITMLVGYLLEAGVPAGVAQVVHGVGEVVGQALAAHPDVHLVSLTGSTEAGIETMKTASQNLTHVMLELGGNDAFILCEDGDLNLAIQEAIQGRLYNAGQVCCASKRFLIHNSLRQKFIDGVVEKIRNLKVGNPLDTNTQMGCLISKQAAIHVEEQVQLTIKEGATVVYGGRRNGAFFEPTVLDNVKPDMEVAKDMEIFGPVISVIGFNNIEEAIEIANQSSFGLCGNVITKNMKTAFYVANRLEEGAAIINGSSFYRSFEMPFGGWKKSGIGNEGILTTLKEMSRTKTIVLKNILK